MKELIASIVMFILGIVILITALFIHAPIQSIVLGALDTLAGAIWVWISLVDNKKNKYNK